MALSRFLLRRISLMAAVVVPIAAAVALVSGRGHADDGPEDKATDIWLSSERSLLPVRVLVVEKDGTRIDQVVTRIGS